MAIFSPWVTNSTSVSWQNWVKSQYSVGGLRLTSWYLSEVKCFFVIQSILMGRISLEHPFKIPKMLLSVTNQEKVTNESMWYIFRWLYRKNASVALLCFSCIIHLATSGQHYSIMILHQLGPYCIKPHPECSNSAYYSWQ